MPYGEIDPTIEHLTRRQLLARSAGLAIGAAGLALLPAPALAQRALPTRDEDLVDEGDAFRRGVGRGVTVAPTPGGPALRATDPEGAFTSATLVATAPFTHVGLHWSASVAPTAELRFEVRASSDGAAWSDWRPVRVEREPDETPVGDTFGALVHTPGARSVQYRATFRTPGGATASLRRVTATVIDSPAVAAVTAGNQLATTVVSDADSGRTLAVTAREQWQADEKLRLTRRGLEVWPEMFVPAKKLVVHHTATRNDYATAADAAAEVRAIYRYHAVTQRWGDIGYTALVDKFGNVYEGRHGRGEGTGREILSAGVVAGHDTAHNYGSAGLALLGDATRADWPMATASGPMWEALVRQAVFESGRHGLRPLRPGASTQTGDVDVAASDFLRSDNVWTNGMRNVSGHRETNATTCPGDAAMALLDELRTAVHAGLAGVSRTGVALRPATPGGRETTANTTLRYEWSLETPETGWTLVGYEHCFEGWHKPSKSYDLSYLSGYTSGTQPRPVWTAVGPTTTSASTKPTAAGTYTFHVRAVLQNSAGQRRSAYEAAHTYLVR